VIRTPPRSPRPVHTTGRAEHHPRGRYLAGRTTRQRILGAALARLTSRGLAGVTITAVAHGAALSTTGLLHHYRSRDALLVGVIANETRAARDSASTSDPRLSRAAAELYIGVLSDGGRCLPLSYALILRLRRSARAQWARAGTAVELTAFDGALLAAMAGDTDAAAQVEEQR